MADADPRQPATDNAALRRQFDLQHLASRRHPPAGLKLRLDRIDRLAALVRSNVDRFAAAISEDFGVRARIETELMELVPTLGAIRHARKNLVKWMRPEKRHVSINFQPGKAWVRHEPLGVIGIISPWNYPLQLALSPLVDAIAAGNRALIKPSELTPAFAELLKETVAGQFDEEEVAVVTGGVEIGRAFSSLPFDHLLFTGSTAVGRQVYKAAAENLVPVTLELGGKSPVILCDDYPLPKAARSIAFGKFLNAGQTCIAPDYVLVPRHKAEALADALLAEVRQSYPTVAGNPDYSGVISQRHRDRLLGAIEAARSGGATVMTHGEAEAASAGKVPPTVVLNAPEETILASEEIFGPILPIVPYDSLDEAIAFVNGRDRPLALYCFTKDQWRERHVLDRTISGGVTLNGTLLHIAQESLPFGGVGASGIGAYHGKEGFKRFSHARAVHKVGAWNAFEKLGPPWGNFARRVAKAMLKRG
ncbi:coniferyl aldehyde dehydrogenase [Sphingomonas sp. BN140010]|uniref:Aldehyde dehydrogenase n=1 Tax=Sphingomonas arvum TaxID=2992113 RepID=A0ABT3JCY9_9SPHN|nr:coniferyl aldehyde dehydrogenase [Sphingomonas sp. BN140010]MCW3796661.1 coniferyl aldehyde dehydrogenase [Sphingomonas sp. BN140010]